MKQDATDDKIIEGCKTCEKQIFQQKKCHAHRFHKNTHTHTHTHNKSNKFYIQVQCDGQITLYLYMYQGQQRILRVVCEKYRKIV